jgi:ribosomal protein S18 acetylase RimI-like enzyme
MFSIRTATSKDAEALAELGTRTFRETFAKDNTPEDMALYLAEHFGGGLQRAELEDNAVVFLLLEAEGHPAGYVKLRKGSANGRGRRPLEVCRFYVDKKWHGKGAAKRLMEAIDAMAVREGHDDVWLAVWEHNARAIRFYEKHGFQRVGEQPFRLGADVQTDWLMARPVRGSSAGAPS